MGSDESPGQTDARWGTAKASGLCLPFSLGYSPQASQSIGFKTRPGPVSCWLCGPGELFPLSGPISSSERQLSLPRECEVGGGSPVPMKKGSLGLLESVAQEGAPG